MNEQELREKIAKEIEDLLDPPPIDEVDHIIWKVIEKCAQVARGQQSGFKEEKRGRVVRDDNGYQLGLILTQLSRIADSLEELVKEIKAK